MSKPRHLKIVKSGHAGWEVLVGNIPIGDVYKVVGDLPYQVQMTNDSTPFVGSSEKFRTMAEAREAIITKFCPHNVYNQLLDEAFKSGYKG